MFSTYRICLLLMAWAGLAGGAAAKPFDSADFNRNAEPLEISRITPEGKDVPASREIVFQFNRPVVPVGKMDRAAADIPIVIAPVLKCEWRWLNTSALACRLTEKDAMRTATRYRVLVQPGIQAEDGATLAKPVTHEFVTQRPDIGYTRFKSWKAPGMPEIRVSFNQAVSRVSVEKHLYFLTEQGKRVALKAAPPKPEDDEGESAGEETAPPETPDYARVWMVAPAQLLPGDTGVHLKVEPGLESEAGPEPGVENRVVVEFDTFPDFAFLGVRCTDNNDQDLFFAADAKPAADARCNPLRQVALVFSTPVISQVVRDNLVVTPDLAGGRKDYDPWQRSPKYSRLDQVHRKGNDYPVWLPELLKAHETYRLQAKPMEFKDEFGRALPRPVDMRFLTAHRKPDYTFEHETSVLEKGVDSEVPIYFTNLDKLRLNYNVLTAQGGKPGQALARDLFKAQDISYKFPLGVRDMLGVPSGVVQGSFETDPPTDNTWNNWFFAQVTPFSVQVKAGHQNTLAWVTDYATGQPVAGVDVGVYQDTYAGLTPQPAYLAQAVTDADGVAMLPGLKDLDPKLALTNSYGREDPHLFLRCRKGEDLALLAFDYPFTVDMYDLSDEYISAWPREKYGHIHTWGTTAQGVYKVGDTIQFKFFVRDQDNKTFVPPPREAYHLQVMDPTGKVVHEIKDLKLSEFGAYAGELTLPKNAAVGWYQFQLKAAFADLEWTPLRVLVSDFTPSPFRVRTELNGPLFRQGDQVAVTTSATLHAGGPYTHAYTQVNAILTQSRFAPEHPLAKGFYFDTYVPDKSDEETVHQGEGEVDDKGLLESRFALPESWVLYGALRVESTVRDDRGKDVANTATAKYVGRDRYVGLKIADWVWRQGQPAAWESLVVDENGQPVAGTAVAVLVERRETKAARVKGAGNAYLTQYTHDWIKEGECAAVSAAAPVRCEFTPTQPGYYQITASIQDSKGREHKTVLNQWASGKGEVVWEMSAGNGLKITPEKNTYKVGETARYLVQNPYPGAKALISVERYGVIKHWVQDFPDSVQMVEFPVEADFIPGYFLSVMVMSPRVDKPLGEGEVDLGKPAFRMGYVQVEVQDPYKEMRVDIRTDKPEYKPRQTVSVDLRAYPRQAELKAGPVELAVAVLDEAVFDLIGKGRDYFDPYKGFYTLDDLDVKNFNLLLRLVGRQKFEKKGATPGGDGGAADLSLRSVFKFVSYWNPSLKADQDGKARFSFEVPDNLTGWRILAMAVTPGDLMGLGDANFKVNQPIELRPLLPNQVTTGDSFSAGFSVMNRTDKTRNVNVEITAGGALDIPLAQKELVWRQTVTVAPYQRELVWLPLKTAAPGQIKLAVTAGDGEESDALGQTLEVRKRRSLETGATYGTTESGEVTESVAFPADIYPDAGGLSVTAAPSVIGNVEGAFEYMRDYPYACWEQKLSKGVMASHYQGLKAWLPDSLEWADAAELPGQTLKLAAEHQAPNGGMAFYLPQDQYVSPYLSAYTALAFAWLRDAGHAVPQAVEDKLHAYLTTLLRRDVMPEFYTKGMASTVRAVALQALARRGQAKLADIERYAPHLPQMSLFGKASFLSAALKVAKTEKLRDEAAKAILAQAEESGGKISFNETLDDAYSRILASPLRDNCAVLSALTEYAGTPKAKGVGEVPVKLARSIVAARKSRTHWENTQENLFCMNALIDYARVFEKDKPDMQVRAFLGQEKLGETKFDDARDPPVTFEHAMTAQDPGGKATVKIEREGAGRLYYTLRMQYAPKAELADPVNAGIEVRREYSVERDGKWELLHSPMNIKSGELVRVDLYLSLPAARNFVVVDDPVPGGLEPVNRDLATASQVAADKAQSDYAGGAFWFKFSDWQEYGASLWSFYHKELRHHAAIFYSDYLPPGNYHLAYVAQAVAPGEFAVLPTHAEEMYSPDVYGKGAPAVLKVERADARPASAPAPAAQADADLAAKGLARTAALLAELGYYTQDIRQPDRAAIRRALSALQKDLGLPVSGRLDDKSWEKLGGVKLSEPRRAEVEAAEKAGK